MNKFLVCLPLMSILAANAQAEAVQFQSGTEPTALLELYTSEGCSSCPPAEAWLSRLKESPGLWKDFVPLAFHVDYWDRLGWRDPWSTREFSDRQRAYADLWRNDSIYTPGFVLNGKEWRNWSEAKAIPKSAGAKTGVLSVSSSDTNHWRVGFAPATANNLTYEISAAVLGGGLSSDVKSGENQGRHLKHDFVVLTLVKTSLTHHGDIWDGTFGLPLPQNGGSLALVVWVTQKGRLEPLQATGGWLVRAAATQ